MDPELGQIYVRLTTWFPFTVQIYVNGHSWLEKQMLKRRIGFNLRDNAFGPGRSRGRSKVGRFVRPSEMVQDPQLHLVRQVNPLMKRAMVSRVQFFCWVVDQAEYAHRSDLHQPRESLAGLYSRLLDHAAINSPSAKDILTFLGRQFPSPV